MSLSVALSFLKARRRHVMKKKCLFHSIIRTVCIAIILMGKRELIALLNLSSWCLVMVERLFLTVPRGCLQFVIVVFPDHTHLLFLNENILTVATQLLYFFQEARECNLKAYPDFFVWISKDNKSVNVRPVIL